MTDDDDVLEALRDTAIFAGVLVLIILIGIVLT